MTVADGAVCVFDGYKTVCFLKEELKGKSEEVTYGGHEVLIRMSDGVEPMAAAELFVDYLKLLRSCPRYRTEKAVNCKDMGIMQNSECRMHNSESVELEMKPKKIKIRILEGEVVV